MATSKLQEFIASVKTGGLMRNARYTVTMGKPASLRSITRGDDHRKILLFCSDITIPGLNISTSPSRTFGEIREMPYEKLYDNCNMTYYVDQDMSVKHYFDSWVHSIQNTETRTFEYYQNYITDVTIEVEDARSESRYKITMFECYPKSVAQIQLGYDNKDVMKMQVSMNYKYWKYEKIAPSGKKEPGPWDNLFKMPTINNNPIG